MISNQPRKRSTGFTLIEMMIVVAIVAILAAIAYPSYAEHVRKGRRGQAKADLLEVTQLLERYRTVNNRYNGFDMTDFAQSPRQGQGTAYYNLALVGPDVDSYSLTATPVGSQLQDTRCGVLSIDQAGVKRIDGTGSAERCW